MSSTPVTVTVCETFQLSVVKVTDAGDTVPSFRLLLDSGMVTLSPGWDVNVICPMGTTRDTEPEAESRLVDMVRTHRRGPLERLRNEILTAVDERRGTRNDDCTLILLRWTPPLDKREHAAPPRVDMMVTAKIHT